MKVRAFIALDIDSEIKEYLRDIQNQLRKLDADIKWVKPENVHVTLKFLGDVPESKIPSIIKVMNQCISENKPFKTSLKGLGAFPNLRRPKVIWAGLDDSQHLMCNMAKHLENSLAEIGIARENREFSPHLTIGRVRSGKNIKSLIPFLETMTIQSDIIQAFNHVTLYKSTLTGQGPTYEHIHKEQLKLT